MTTFLSSSTSWPSLFHLAISRPQLLNYDQLRTLMATPGHPFYFGFEEGAITFAPTYRYKRGTREEYAFEKLKAAGVIKINVPSWCDRVLWRSFPNTYIRQTSYGCTTDITTSDHSPVFSTFEVAMAHQYVRKHENIESDCAIQLISVDVR